MHELVCCWTEDAELLYCKSGDAELVRCRYGWLLHRRLVVPTTILKKEQRRKSNTTKPEKNCLVDFQYGSLDKGCVFFTFVILILIRTV